MTFDRSAKNSRLLAAAALAAATALTGVAAAGPAAAAPSGAAASGLSLTGLTMVLNWQHVTGLAPDGKPRVGTDTDYDISVYAADGSLVGDQRGNTLIVSIDPVTGHIFVAERDTVQLADGGTFLDAGLIDTTASYHGVQQTVYVVGVGGSVAGEVGVYHYTPERPLLAPKIWQATASIELQPVTP